jgi:Tfp pilus assembly protein PilV
MGNLMNKHSNSYRGFGLIEVLISGVVLITIISATASVRQRTTSQSSYSRHEEVATMLAQEGIEAVRQIRDTNYLIQMKDTTGAVVKVPWDCYLLRHSVHATPDGTDLISSFQTYRIDQCDNAIWSDTTMHASGGGSRVLEIPNRGDFSRTEIGVSTVGALNAYTIPPAELSKNTNASTFPTDNTGTQHVRVTDFNLSYPGFSDSTMVEMSSPLVDLNNLRTVAADKCLGVERIFVNEGNVALKRHPSYAANRPYISANFRPRTASSADVQDNYDVMALGEGCGWGGWGGMTEFHRQVAISPTNTAQGNTPLEGDSKSNWPKEWTTGITPDHFARVLVRVSWNEQSRFSVNGADNAVLLVTYLTDWRP